MDLGLYVGDVGVELVGGCGVPTLQVLEGGVASGEVGMGGCWWSRSWLLCLWWRWRFVEFGGDVLKEFGVDVGVGEVGDGFL